MEASSELCTAMIVKLERFREIFKSMDPLNTRIHELRRILEELKALGFEHVAELKENLDEWVESEARRLERLREIANQRELPTATIENLRERFREIFRGFENPQNTSEETCTARFRELRRILADLEVLRYDHVAEMKEVLWNFSRSVMIENLIERFREIVSVINSQNRSEETCTACVRKLRRILEELEALGFEHVAAIKKCLDEWVESEARRLEQVRVWENAQSLVRLVVYFVYYFVATAYLLLWGWRTWISG